MRAPADDALLLALDTGSPVVSVAVGRSGRVMAQRSVEIARSAEDLIAMVDDALAAAGAAPRDLGGVVALRGPGSFTGLRIGLATALGLHDALAIPAAAVPTHHALAAAAPPEAERVIAAVDALRGEWFVQPFAAGARPLGPPEIVATAGLERLDAACLIGFGLDRLAFADGGPMRHTPPPLAPAALALAWHGEIEWSANDLVHPLYLREPATTPPKR